MAVVGNRLLVGKIFERHARYLCTQPTLKQSVKEAPRSICPNRLQDRIAIVTGSTDGIGLSIAERFCQEGAKVIISSRRAKKVKKVVDRLQSQGYVAEGIACDVAQDHDRKNLIKETIEKYGGVDIFISNAGSNSCFGSILESNLEHWKETFDVNLKSHLLLTQILAPHMRKRNNPCSMVYISSVTGYTPLKFLPAYSVSKTALLALTKAIATDLAGTNIRVNCIAPGMINTKMTLKGLPHINAENFDSLQPEQKIMVGLQETKELFLRRIPMGRLGEPNEIAGAAAFLCSDDASYISGETLTITGGIQARI